MLIVYFSFEDFQELPYNDITTVVTWFIKQTDLGIVLIVYLEKRHRR